jgi:hypothetical protein
MQPYRRIQHNKAFFLPMKTTKTERRILAAERTAAMYHIPLEAHLKAKAERRTATSGSKPCVCGQLISANKQACRTCSAVADLAMRDEDRVSGPAICLA